MMLDKYPKKDHCFYTASVRADTPLRLDSCDNRIGAIKRVVLDCNALESMPFANQVGREFVVVFYAHKDIARKITGMGNDIFRKVMDGLRVVTKGHLKVVTKKLDDSQLDIVCRVPFVGREEENGKDVYTLEYDYSGKIKKRGWWGKYLDISICGPLLPVVGLDSIVTEHLPLHSHSIEFK